jgi:hypothetical protein
MSYVPPHLRNRKETVVPKIVEAEFPKFVSTHKPVTAFKGPSFLEKVAEQPKNDNIVYRETPTTTLRHRSFHFQKKEESESSSSEDDIPRTTTDNDGWQVVERKLRVKRDKIQEAIDNDDAPVEEEETAWADDQPDEHETYWDERRH